MKHFLSLLLIALSTTAIAQPGNTPPAPAPLPFEEMQLPPVREPENYQNYMEQLRHAINNEPQSIFNLLSDKMILQYGRENMIAYVKGLKDKYGAMHETRFITMSGRVAVYEVDFDKNREMIAKIGTDNNNRITSFNFMPRKEVSLAPVINVNTTKLSLPYNGQWAVASGGITERPDGQSLDKRGSVTFVMRSDKGTGYKTTGATNSDYLAFGQPILAPCNATVANIIEGINDNEPGNINTMFAGGNTVVLKTDKDEYIVLGHLKANSIKVKKGDNVKKGATIAECGNSGDSEEPSLYFGVQNTDGTSPAIGAKILFNNVSVIMPDGKTEIKENYTPVVGTKAKAK